MRASSKFTRALPPSAAAARRERKPSAAEARENPNPRRCHTRDGKRRPARPIAAIRAEAPVHRPRVRVVHREVPAMEREKKSLTSDERHREARPDRRPSSRAFDARASIATTSVRARRETKKPKKSVKIGPSGSRTTSPTRRKTRRVLMRLPERALDVAASARDDGADRGAHREIRGLRRRTRCPPTPPPPPAAEGARRYSGVNPKIDGRGGEYYTERFHGRAAGRGRKSRAR